MVTYNTVVLGTEQEEQVNALIKKALSDTGISIGAAVIPEFVAKVRESLFSSEESRGLVSSYADARFQAEKKALATGKPKTNAAAAGPFNTPPQAASFASSSETDTVTPGTTVGAPGGNTKKSSTVGGTVTKKTNAKDASLNKSTGTGKDG